VGAYGKVEIVLSEVDEQGLRRRRELFGADRLGDAIVRLYERYAELLPDTPSPGRSGAQAATERARAAATARSVAAMAGPLDAERWAVACAPDIEVVDHRTLGTWSARGREALMEHCRSMREVAGGAVTRDDDVLALRSDALLLRKTHLGADRVGGGAYERPLLTLRIYGSDGLTARIEYFDEDRDAEALARFDELIPSPFEGLMGSTAEGSTARPAPVRFENAATRNVDRFNDAYNADDWERIATTLAPRFRRIDRRMVVNLGRDLDKEQYIGWSRATQNVGLSRVTMDTMATRGDRLALGRVLLESSSDMIGSSEIEHLMIIEVDEAGSRVANIVFEPDDLDAAYAELDERWQAGVPALQQRIAARDWDGVAALYASDLIARDHRLVGWGTLHGPAAFLESMRQMVELSPDVRLRIKHVRAAARGYLVEGVWLGTRDGGAFESVYVAVAELDANGRIRRVDFYDSDKLDVALARFGELRNPSVSPPGKATTDERAPRPSTRRRWRPNAVTASAARLEGAITACDADVLANAWSEDFECVDHTTGAAFGRKAVTATWRSLLAAENRSCRYEPLATLGDSLALLRFSRSGSSITFDQFDVGAFEVTEIHLLEGDAAGRLRRAEIFAADRLEDAVARLYVRFTELLPDTPSPGRSGAQAALERERAAAIARSFAALVIVDPDRRRMAVAPDIEHVDWRTAGTGTMHGAEAFVRRAAALIELSEGFLMRIDDILALRSDALLAHVTSSGTDRASGGAFERLYLWLVVSGADGLAVRIEVFDSDRDAEALARFDDLVLNQVEELAAPPARFADLEPDPLRIPPNAATRAFERRMEASNAGDWEALESLCAPTLVYEDRRRLIRTTGDRDMFIAHCKWVGSRGAVRVARTVLATAGDSSALMHLRWTGARDGPSIEIEQLCVWEVDVERRIVAIIGFDPDDRRAASKEMLQRYARSAAARCVPAAAFEAYRALNDHDLDRFRATLHDDFVFDDRRRTGVGRLEGADAYVASLRPLFAAAPDFCADNLYDIATEPHGWLTIGRTSGSLAEGGEFESVYVRLFICRGDRLAGIEHFELEHLDVARARFEALRG
jgi:hypothetical protein